MAARVEATTREMGQSLINPDKPSVSASALPGDTGKPALGPKPHLMPKPFALQRNATVHPIRAPKTNFSRELHRAASSEALLDIKKPGAGGPNLSESQKSGSNGTVNGSNQIAAPKPVPLGPKPDLLAKPKPEPTKSPGSNNQTGPNSKPAVTAEDLKDVQPRSRAKSLGSQDQKILNQKDRGEAAKTEADVKVPSRCWPPRNRLSVELTSKFESASRPEKEMRRDAETSKTEKEWPPHSPSESKPSKLPVDKGEMGDEDVSGGSIKRRISLLFDRSTAAQHRDTFNKRDNPAAEISVDIKQRIQNLSLDVPRTRLPSTGGPKSPPSEKTLSTSDETPSERSSEKPAATEKVPVSTAEIKNSAASVDSVEEEEDHEDEEEDYVPVPVYQRVGMSLDMETKRREEEEKQRKDEQLEKERQQRERERLLEEERKAREIERQKEEERKRAEEERKQEEEKQRQMEERRKQEEERKRRIEEARKEEERRRQAEKERERQIEEEKRRIEEEKERLREEERVKKEREMEEERRRIQELERQRAEERLRQERENVERLKKEREMEERKRMEEERQREEERLRREQEKERLKKEKEMEEERRRIQELERQKEEERLRQEREKEERLKKQREMEERKRMEEERLKEEEILRQEREMERIRKEKEMEEERQRIQEIERQKEEERLRKERELERIRKEKEMEEERQRIQRQKEEERLRQEREIERLRKEREIEERKRMEEERQREEERLRQERERERLKKEKEMEEERRRIQELERQKEEERLRKERELERIRKEKEMEEERRRIQELERQKEEERLRKEQELESLKKEKEIEEERRRTQEIERQIEAERLRKERELERIRKEKEMEEERRRTQVIERQKEEQKRRQEQEHEMAMETCEAAERSGEKVSTSYDLISFDAEEPAASQTLVSTVQLADVSPRLAQVTYDDFSVKPRRWGTRARRSSTPSPTRETPAAPDHSLQPESKSSHPGPQEPSGDQVSVHDLIGFEPEASSPHNSTESRTHTYLFEAETESKPGDLLEPETDEGQLKDDEPEEDTENLIWETDEQTENNDTVDDPATQIRINQALQRLTQARRRNTSTDSDTADVQVQEELEPLPVLESAAPLLDSSVFRSKVDLGKKRSIKRTRPSRAVRQKAALPALTEGTQPDWRFCDSTDAKDQCSNGADSESEEEPSRDVTSSPAPSQSKRVPVFPGMDPSALMAQLKRRSAAIETESPTEAQTPPSVPSRSPCTPTMALGPRVLPPVDAKDSGSRSSPSWLLELKSKKRMSQPESEA
uniref:Tankyrase 1-binding protein C-terminal domain-containing protein n=1 Tax=Cyprinus carpio TaxID=7962 RepID=A0A8C2ARL9_CYPCA